MTLPTESRPLYGLPVRNEVGELLGRMRVYIDTWEQIHRERPLHWRFAAGVQRVRAASGRAPVASFEVVTLPLRGYRLDNGQDQFCVCADLPAGRLDSIEQFARYAK